MSRMTAHQIRANSGRCGKSFPALSGVDRLAAFGDEAGPRSQPRRLDAPAVRLTPSTGILLPSYAALRLRWGCIGGWLRNSLPQLRSQLTRLTLSNS